jgi:hypothetical protein
VTHPRTRGGRRTLALAGLLFTVTACRKAPVAGDHPDAATGVPTTIDTLAPTPPGAVGRRAPIVRDLTRPAPLDHLGRPAPAAVVGRRPGPGARDPTAEEWYH